MGCWGCGGDVVVARDCFGVTGGLAAAHVDVLDPGRALSVAGCVLLIAVRAFQVLLVVRDAVEVEVFVLWFPPHFTQRGASVQLREPCPNIWQLWHWVGPLRLR